jgi:hypothetical protein
MVALAAQAIAGIKAGVGQTSSRRPSQRRRGLVDRLGEQTIRELMRDSRLGATRRALAERYNISLSSVKRLVHQNRRTS